MTTIDNAGGEEAVEPGDTADVEVGETADVDLVLRTRSGDRGAFGELWYRHYRSGIAVARAVTSAHEPDDLVQEAYSRIYRSILRGGGPTGSFRAYLFASIRNTAAAWGRAGRETAFDEFESIEDPATSEQATEAALDRGLTHRAFRSLPSRWQEVLWYTEIEQMKPAEVAPLLGMKPTAVAQLAFRAREGLREAWIQAHLQSVADGSDCQWTIEHLGAHARANLSRRDQRKVDEHLGDCARCSIVAAEAKEVSSRLALVLLPLTLGVTAAASYLATLQGGGVAVVALAAGAAPAVAAAPAASVALAPSVGAGSSGSGAAGASTAAGGSTAVGATSAAGASAGAGAAGAAGASGVAAAGVAAAGAVAAGGIFSSVGAVIGATAAAVLIAGSAVTASVVIPAVLPDDSNSTKSETSVVSVDGTTPADEPAPDAVTDPDGSSNAEAAQPLDTGAAEGAPGDQASARSEPVAALPAGIPSIGGADVQYAGTQPTFTVPVRGVPGATVEVLLNGSAKSTVVLDASGTATTAVQPTYGNVTSNARVQWRYRAGELKGEALSVRLSDLGDLAAVLAVMQPSPSGGVVAGVPGTGNGQSTGNGKSNGNGSANGQGPGSANGNGSANGQGNGSANGQGNGAANGTATGQGSGSANGHTTSNGLGSANGTGPGSANGTAGPKSANSTTPQVPQSQAAVSEVSPAKGGAAGDDAPPAESNGGAPATEGTDPSKGKTANAADAPLSRGVGTRAMGLV